MSKLTYDNSGVNIAAGEKAVDLIKKKVKTTFNKNVLNELGSFGGLYQLDLSQWKKPVLVSSVDGVGTKLLIAEKAGIYDTVGQDLVNHCVDDIFVQGAVPQYFLDYIGVGKLVPEHIEKIIDGFVKACRENEMALIAGEMAEMPDVYSAEDFDLAGTIVGLVEKDEVITGEDIKEGDVLLGFSSNGLHTNGYSLARKVFFDHLNLKVDSMIPGFNSTVAEELLKVHKSYLPILKKWAKPEYIHGMAHITGGGIPGNLKRIIPKELTAIVETSKWEKPAIFNFIQDAGKIDDKEMLKTFNMGIGFIVVTDESNARIIEENTQCCQLGFIEKNKNTSGVKLI